MFFYIYIVLAVLIYAVSLPLLIVFAFKKKYREAIPARFFLWKNPPLRENGVLFHLCSFGEARAVAPLLEAVPREDLRITCITQTGFGLIREYTDQSRYLPFEPLLLAWLRPQKALVVVEAELWYLLFFLLRRKGAKTLLVNARMSDHSFHRYQRFSWLYRNIFKEIDEVYAQTDKDKERLLLLGARQVVVTGNIKSSVLPAATKIWTKPNAVLVVAASTHEGEETLILEAFSHLKREDTEARLVIAPRHPERFESVARMIDLFAQEHNVTCQRYSENSSISSDIMLLDVLGELVNLYAIADVVILGGAFVPVGGHNVIEAAQFGCRIISGKHYFNQRDLFSAVEGIALVEKDALWEVLLHYTEIRPSKIRYRGSIAPIIESLTQIRRF